MTELNLHGQFILAQRSAAGGGLAGDLSKGQHGSGGGNNERGPAEQSVQVVRMRFNEVSQ